MIPAHVIAVVVSKGKGAGLDYAEDVVEGGGGGVREVVVGGKVEGGGMRMGWIKCGAWFCGRRGGW